ncbi:MAG: acetyltransferase [Chlamydiales bacterium]|jgi:putative acetyltransferase|nr:acetyltransferase [Chlamydiales bacterium]
MAIDLSEVKIRYTKLCDSYYLKQWLSEPGILRWFPIYDDKELDDSVKRWIDFSKLKCSITASYKGNPCGIATMYLHPYKKLIHQCEFGIIVGKNCRGGGVGNFLIQQLMLLAKNKFKIELIHLQVYEGNPAFGLYQKMGFKEFGRQDHWLKEENGEYAARIFMERSLADIPTQEVTIPEH